MLKKWLKINNYGISYTTEFNSKWNGRRSMPCCRSVWFRRRTSALGRASPFRRCRPRIRRSLRPTFRPCFPALWFRIRWNTWNGCRWLPCCPPHFRPHWLSIWITSCNRQTDKYSAIDNLQNYKMKWYLMFFCYLKKMNFNYYYNPGVNVKLVANSSLQ